MVAVSVRGLTKEYGSLRAVDDVSFEVGEGEVYGLLGHNGAGKSTVVEILEGHRARTAGDVDVLGHDPGHRGRAMRDRIGIVLQASGIEAELTVGEAIGIYGLSYRRTRPLDEVVGLVGLGHKVDARIGTLSGGQRRRLDLALGIIGYPELLFLDEPTTGFDPAARREAWLLVDQLCAGGTTVLLTTHYLDEAERLAGRVGVLAAGRLVAEGAPAKLIAGVAGTVVRFAVDVGELETLPLPAGATRSGEHVEFTTTTPTADVHAVTAWAVERDVELTGLTVSRPSLEDAFLQLASEEQDS